MITTTHLIEAFERNIRIIQMQTEGLTHTDSLLQMPFRANCLNWVVGHVLANRDGILKSIGEETLLSDEEIEVYKRESEPVSIDGAGIIPLQRMLELLARGQERISASLADIKIEEFSKDIQVGDRNRTLGERLFFLYFHETYHVGQTEFLRQMAGKDDKVI